MLVNALVWCSGAVCKSPWLRGGLWKGSASVPRSLPGEGRMGSSDPSRLCASWLSRPHVCCPLLPAQDAGTCPEPMSTSVGTACNLSDVAGAVCFGCFQTSWREAIWVEKRNSAAEPTWRSICSPGPKIGGIYGERRESRSLSWQETPRRDLGGCWKQDQALAFQKGWSCSWSPNWELSRISCLSCREGPERRAGIVQAGHKQDLAAGRGVQDHM